MNLHSFFVLCFLFLTKSLLCQVSEDVQKKPLKTVLLEIEKVYAIKFVYDEKNIKDVFVFYSSNHHLTNLNDGLKNILSPVDLVSTEKSIGVYTITKKEQYKMTIEEGKIHLDKLLASYPKLADWERRKADLRKCILEEMELSPIPKKTPLNPIYTPKRVMDGYAIENVAIEVIPGVYLCGSLYKPLKGNGPFPAVLTPHGHFRNLEKPMNMDERGRYRPDQQYRCAILAKMGAVVFSYDMFAWGESVLQVDQSDHQTGLALTMQTLYGIRVLDFLNSLPYINSKRIGVTAASGGGTQAFLIAALDDRISVSVPVVIVSAYYAGHCPCESGMPIHSCTDLGTNNAEIAAMASPRPQLVISDGEDWTKTTPILEFPYLQKVYGLYGKTTNVENVHLAKEGHDYGISKRMAMYEFMARNLGLNINAIKDKNGKIDETTCTIEKYEDQLVFGKEGKVPANAVKGPDAIKKVLKSLQ